MSIQTGGRQEEEVSSDKDDDDEECWRIVEYKAFLSASSTQKVRREGMTSKGKGMKSGFFSAIRTSGLVFS